MLIHPSYFIENMLILNYWYPSFVSSLFAVRQFGKLFYMPEKLFLTWIRRAKR
ncbi:Uncharacterized protein dnm_047940 [Desulfonema magnum]|uniref:Uncharacterized protein n=1 Tax=Desulfonema magnum TaxID=45655 RepID=A0A975BNE5_9BACT|nr:Uncharacterized protein dnm_047940 [Desulfonema magnum]